MARARKVKKRRGRPAGATRGRTQDAILRAARYLFAKDGFGGTSMRSIAKRARVDGALVHYFFQTKAKLFAAAVELPSGSDRLHEVMASGEGPLGERVVRYFLDDIVSTGNPAIVALLRSAIADPSCVPALRSTIQRRIVSLAASAIAGPSAHLRAELLGSQLVGLFVVRHVVGVEPLASASTSKVAKLFGPSIEALLE